MSLEGLTALIQLESTRLEGTKITTSNSAQVGASIQEVGLQTAEKKVNLTLQRINAEYEKDCAAATVRRLEAKYARQGNAASLAGSIAALVTAGSALSNLWGAGKDLFAGGQKLGDIPKSLQVNPIDPNASDTKLSVTQNEGGSRTITIQGRDDDSKNVVHSFKMDDVFKISGKGIEDLNKEGLDQNITNSLKPLLDQGFTRGDFEKKLSDIGVTDDQKQLIMNHVQISSTASSFKSGTFTENEMKNTGEMKENLRDMSRGEAKDFFKLVDGVQKNSQKNDVGLTKKDVDAVKDGLISNGKATEHDFKSGFDRMTDNIGDGANALVGAMVQTAQDAVPYFQAYMKARDQVDQTLQQLQEAIAKLNAANKKLSEIEQAIDKFASIGA